MDIKSATETAIIGTLAILIVITNLRATLTGVTDRIHLVTDEGLTRKTHAGKAVPRYSAATPIHFRGTVHKRSNLRAITSVLTPPKLPSILQQQIDFRTTLQTDVTSWQTSLLTAR
jgi:hypothetical protein